MFFDRKVLLDLPELSISNRFTDLVTGHKTNIRSCIKLSHQ